MNLTKLDKAFSEYIRRRYADDNGYIKCVTCPTVKHWKEMDCGHFIPRKHLKTRWHEKNTGPQCVECNRFGNGEVDEFREYIAIKYGSHVLDELYLLSHIETHFTQFEIDELTEYYKTKIKEL